MRKKYMQKPATVERSNALHWVCRNVYRKNMVILIRPRPGSNNSNNQFSINIKTLWV